MVSKKSLDEILNFFEKWPIGLMPLLVLLAIPLTVYNQPHLGSKATALPYSASLLLSPSQKTIILGEVLRVEVLLSTNEAKINGVDAVLRYDPQMLRFLEIQKSGLFEEYVGESVDVTKGEICFSGLTLNPQPKSGALGTILFEPLSQGTTTVFFEFIPGATRGDSNVALTGSGGVDILKEVGSGRYIIE